MKTSPRKPILIMDGKVVQQERVVEMEEVALFRLARTGDLEAFNQLVLGYQSLVYQHACRQSSVYWMEPGLGSKPNPERYLEIAEAA